MHRLWGALICGSFGEWLEKDIRLTSRAWIDTAFEGLVTIWQASMFDA